MRVLALDLGLNCGWAATLDGLPNEPISMEAIKINDKLFDLFHGTWHLKKQGDDFITPIAKFRSHLEAFNKVDAVAYEDVKGIFRGNYAALNYGGFKTLIELYALEREIPIYPVPVGTIKKFISGKGNCNKQAVMSAVRARGYVVHDHNEADAVALLSYIIETNFKVKQ